MHYPGKGFGGEASKGEGLGQWALPTSSLRRGMGGGGACS